MDIVFQRSYRGQLKAILLDWAGTTMDYGCCAPAVVFIEVFKRKGVEITMQQAREPMGVHKKVHIRQISQLPAVLNSVHTQPSSAARIDRSEPSSALLPTQLIPPAADEVQMLPPQTRLARLHSLCSPESKKAIPHWRCVTIS